MFTNISVCSRCPMMELDNKQWLHKELYLRFVAFLNLLFHAKSKERKKIKKITRSWWLLKRLRLQSHVIMTSPKPVDECSMKSSEEGLLLNKFDVWNPSKTEDENFSKSYYKFFKATPLEADLGLLQDQIWSSLLQCLVASLTPDKEV